MYFLRRPHYFRYLNNRQHDLAGHYNPINAHRRLLRALGNGEWDEFETYLRKHLHSASKTWISEHTGIPRQTLYALLDESKPFNPTWVVLRRLLSAMKNKYRSASTLGDR